MKEKLLSKGNALKSAAVCFATYATAMMNTMVFAGGNANTALTEVFKAVGKIVVVLGVVLCIFGIVHYASANSEGDGPAKHKAMMQIASGAMVLILGFMLTSGGFSAIINMVSD